MSDKHIAKLQPHESHKKGCVTKHQDEFKEGDDCSYRGNGYKEMKSSHKGLYHIDFTQAKHAARLPRIYREYKIGTKKTVANLIKAKNPKEKKDAWWFKGENYKKGFVPWNHNHHHILPFNALQILTYDELKLLQLSGYNLNAGNNMIILPCLDAYGIAMMLPSHPFGHPTYNFATKSIVREIKRDITKNSRGHELNKTNVPNFKTKLESWQKRQFDVLVKYGKSLAAKESPYSPPPNQVNKSPIATS